MTIQPKHLMSEEDIKLQYITPAITSKWNVKKIAMEAKVIGLRCQRQIAAAGEHRGLYQGKYPGRICFSG